MDFLPFEPTAWNMAMVVLAFAAAGLCKGILGIGIPLIAVPLLTGVMHPAVTISVLATPIVVANLWQGFEGGRAGRVTKRFWPVMVTLIAGSAMGAQFLTEIDPVTAQLILGVIVVVFSLSQFKTLVIPDPSAREKWLSPVVGLVAGWLGGVATFFGPVLVMYLVALRLSKDMFVSTIALLYLIGTVPLFIVLAWKGVLGQEELILSLAGTAIVMAFVVVGRRLRTVISSDRFRQGLLIVLVLMGLNMIRRAVM